MKKAELKKDRMVRNKGGKAENGEKRKKKGKEKEKSSETDSKAPGRGKMRKKKQIIEKR